MHLGLGAGLPGWDRPSEPGIESSGKQLWRNITKCRGKIRGPRSGASLRAEWTSTATASSWVALAPAGTWQALTEASAKGPLNGPTATGRHCPKAGRSIKRQGRSSKTSPVPAALDSHYYVWVRSVRPLWAWAKTPPSSPGNSSDSLVAREVNGKFTSTARPLSAGILCQRHGMGGFDDPKGGLARQRSVDHLGYTHAVPQRNGKRDES